MNSSRLAYDGEEEVFFPPPPEARSPPELEWCRRRAGGSSGKGEKDEADAEEEEEAPRSSQSGDSFSDEWRREMKKVMFNPSPDSTPTPNPFVGEQRFSSSSSSSFF